MSERYFKDEELIDLAVSAAKFSGCEKSKRGVVIFHPFTGQWLARCNSQPKEFTCTGSDLCRENCRDLCIHAEEDAMFDFVANWPGVNRAEVELLHVKIRHERATFSDRPSCLRCSTKILKFGFKGIWLNHLMGLKFYPAEEFHRLTLEFHGLHEMPLNKD